MQVKISASEFEVKNTLPGVKNMAVLIDEAMQENKSQFSHLIVDGVVITDAPLDYVKQNRKGIKDVEVIFATETTPLQKKKSTESAPRAKTGPILVTISNIAFEVKRTLAGVKEMFGRIDESMSDFGVFFSHLIIDSVEVTERPYDYVEEHFKQIGTIEVAFITQDQYLEQVMGIMDAFLANAVPALKNVADEFYGRPDDETWGRFEACLGGISSLLGIINSMVTDPALAGKAGEFAAMGESIGLHLENLHTAARLNDYTLMADIMYYELVKFLEKLHEAVTELVRSQDNATH